MMEEWQQLRHDYARAFESPDEYEDVYFLAMGRYGEHMGRRESGSWFTHPEEAGADGEAIRDWWRDVVRRLKPTVEQRDHFLIYASDLLFMDGDMEKAWSDFLVVPREYVREAFEGVGVAVGQENIEFAQAAYAEGIPALYTREMPRGLRDNGSHPQELVFFKNMAEHNVPPEFVRTIRHHGMAHLVGWNIQAWESGVPAEFIAQYKEDSMLVIQMAWANDLPIEYARAAYSQS